MPINYSKLNIIYHHPRAIVANGLSGSQVRPYKMLQAFKELEVNVTEVAGDYRGRSEIMRRVKRRIRAGEHFDFVYSENLTVPFAMSEPHRLPLHPFLDHQFLHFCHSQKIPVSMFYRDIFWRDTSYKTMLPWWGRVITLPLYHFDWWWLGKYSKVLYIPSAKMVGSLPKNRASTRVLPLPPGTDFHPLPENIEKPISPHLNILYVGGIEPPTYDLEPLLTCARRANAVRLTVCCREKEWNKHQDRYKSLMDQKIKIVHYSGTKLRDLYHQADVLAIIRKPTDYLDFAVPVKLFESIGFGVPILSTPESETARIVNNEGLGWVKDLNELPQFIDFLASNKNYLQETKERVNEARANHTWRARAAQICADMIGQRCKVEGRDTKGH